MSDKRETILHWAQTGHIKANEVQNALRVAEAQPGKQAWFDFINQALIWMAVIALGCGVVFFFAYNWAEMGRFAKFAWLESIMVVAMIIYLKLDIGKGASVATLLGWSILMGALLALTGQTYQTGADPWQLFAVWCFFITPLALIGRSNSIYLLWLGLLNLSLFLYLNTFRSFFIFRVREEEWFWFFIAFNASLQIVFEYLVHNRKLNLQSDWFSKRVLVQVCAVIVGVSAVSLAVNWIFAWGGASVWGVVFYIVWAASTYYFYRYRLFDLSILSGVTLSFVTVSSCLIGKVLGDILDDTVFLLMSLVIIAISAAGGIHLKRLYKQSNDSKGGV